MNVAYRLSGILRKTLIQSVPTVIGISNPEIDALLGAATVEFDPTKRKQQFARFQQFVAGEDRDPV